MPNYCNRSNIEYVYGQRVVTRWADLDGEEDHYDMANRINWACELATEYVNSRLMRAHYVIPFVDVPVMVVNITAMQAGIFLHDGRAVVSTEDMDRVSRQRKDVLRYIRQILRGQLKLLHPTTQEELSITIENQGPFRIKIEADTANMDDGKKIIFGGD